MITEPRREERAIQSPREMELLLERMPVGRMAVNTTDGPYAVAVNYLFLEGNIYFHSAHEGRKIEALRADPRICFLVDDVGPLVLFEKGCGISQIYESVVCFGKVEFVEDPIEKRRVLECMLRKFMTSERQIPPIADKDIHRTALAKIVIESMSGKAHRLSSSHTVLNGKTD
jgi:hypothetical protein